MSHLSMNKRSSKILDYSESDFPSLDPNDRRRNNHDSRMVQVPVPRKTALKSEPARMNEVRSSSTGGRNSSLKVLKPHEHKETYSISVNEAIAKTQSQTTIKNRPIVVKNSTRDEYLSGNPLDADNPLRRKGKFGLPKKPKRISKTKKNVVQVRENVLKAKELAKNIVIEAGCIHHDSNLESEDLQNALYMAKLAEMRKFLKCLNEESDDSGGKEAEESEKNEKNDFASDPNVTDFRKVLETSSIPAHLLLVHNHNFKRYCDNCISKTLNETVAALISQIVRFQQNKFQRNPMKAVANRRFVLGFKQTIKYTRMSKIKMIICVPDMEDGMSEVVDELKSLATAYSIPYLFALTRRQLGALTYKKVGVCCFGILDYSSAEDNFNRVNEEALIAKGMYHEKCSSAKEYCEINLGMTWDGNPDQSKAEELDADTRELVTEIQEKLLLNRDKNIEN